MRAATHRCRRPGRSWLLLGVLAVLPIGLQAQQAPSPASTAAAYAPGTGDAWVDRQLADINAYAARYPDAFIDELSRYAGARPAYVEALLREHGWKPGDVYFACMWGHVTGNSCREPVRAHTALPDAGWKAVVETLEPAPDNLHWRALRHAIVASYDHWDRPITLDALLQRQLGDRAKRDAAARKAD
ncbi:hypothetical protein [Stenotrophomonas sp. SY1]|uniref:hypothetical protein n=1 Tax=Stenotrophomonas sp. SY1 TaxID=477235 RepID=UPI001E51D8DA|nr:hypothetical protein [Stenotrophomonas sp. SY1]MCD9088436.1 hypothetical protein [Stenotrophomonas sp. SY1]